MYTVVVILISIIAVFLMLVVLVQNSKGGGLASGLSVNSQVMGVRRTTDLLEKLTWGFVIALLMLSLTANLMLPRSGEGSSFESQAAERAKQGAGTPAPAGTPIGAPGQGVPPAQPAPTTPTP